MATLTQTDIAEVAQGPSNPATSNGDGFIDPDEFHVLLEKLDGDVSRAGVPARFRSRRYRGRRLHRVQGVSSFGGRTNAPSRHCVWGRRRQVTPIGSQRPGAGDQSAQAASS